MSRLRILFALLVLTVVGHDGAVASDKPTVSEPALPANFLFDRHTTKDRHGRTITFYLSKVPKDVDAAVKRPVVVFVCGSGCQSVFMKIGDKVSVGLPGLMYSVLDGKSRVLVVEKIGVKCFDNPETPGSAVGASEQFLNEHTLDRWVEANHAALRTALTLPGIDPKQTLAVGHSEGAGVVARLASREPLVTHVACLAGSGPPQLFDLVESAGKRAGKDGVEAASRAREAIFAGWEAVLADPNSTSKLWLGHPHRRWSTFGTASSVDDLLKTKANIFLAHGTDDQAVPVSSFDVAVASLRANGRKITADRVENGDHGFAKPGEPVADGFRRVLKKLAVWFNG